LSYWKNADALGRKGASACFGRAMQLTKAFQSLNEAKAMRQRQGIALRKFL
jgi:hypothetical protein